MHILPGFAMNSLFLGKLMFGHCIIQNNVQLPDQVYEPAHLMALIEKTFLCIFKNELEIFQSISSSGYIPIDKCIAVYGKPTRTETVNDYFHRSPMVMTITVEKFL